MLSKCKRVLGLVNAAAILVQAGSAATASVSAKTVNACKLATAKEIAKILGVQLGAPTLDDPTRCQYTSTSGTLVTIATAPYTAAVKSDFAVNSKQPTAKKIPGLKKAYVSTRVLRADSVKGTKFLTIAILSTTGAETGVTTDELIKLTKVAFKRL